MVMVMIRIHNDNLGRILHFALHQRLYNFCIKYTPEFPAEIAVNNWLNRVFMSDPNLHLLVEVDDAYTITEHALVEVQSARVRVNTDHKVIYCHQAQHDKPSISHAVELMEYIDKLREHEGAIASIFSIANARHAAQFQKRHGYQILRTVLIKTSEEDRNDG